MDIAIDSDTDTDVGVDTDVDIDIDIDIMICQLRLHSLAIVVRAKGVYGEEYLAVLAKGSEAKS